LRVIGLSRSTYYYKIRSKKNGSEKQSKTKRGCIPSVTSITEDGRKISNEQIKEWICELIEDEEGICYGYVKITHTLRREYQLIINKKKVYRLCKELNVLRPQRKIKAKYPRRIARNRTVEGSNQVWETDIKYGYIVGEDRFFYVLIILDVYDRSIVGFHIGRYCEGSDVVRTLNTALFKRQLFEAEKKPVIRSDNGPQFVSIQFGKACLEWGVEHERIPMKTPNKNAHVEAYNAILELECLSRHEFLTFAEAYEVVHDHIRFYNEVRIHSSLKYRTPSECYQLFLKNQLHLKVVEL
jgi:putative transposase